VVIVNQGTSQPQSQVKTNPEETAQADPNMPNYKKWWDFFFKY